MSVEPIVETRAATVKTDGKRLLVLADYHAGIENVLQAEGVEIDSRANTRRERVLDLLAESEADRLVVLGDLVHSIGEPWREERDEVQELFGALPVPVTLVKGNHDGEIESIIEHSDQDVTLSPVEGTRIGTVGFVHGHTWPSAEVLAADIVCMGHEHPLVKLEDSVGGGTLESAWLRGPFVPEPFEKRGIADDASIDGELIVLPAFNERSGGTRVNAPAREFLSPFLPDGARDIQVYLLDGTRLGALSEL